MVCKKTHGMNHRKNLGTSVPSQQGQLIYRFSKVRKPTLGSAPPPILCVMVGSLRE